MLNFAEQLGFPQWEASWFACQTTLLVEVLLPETTESPVVWLRERAERQPSLSPQSLIEDKSSCVPMLFPKHGTLPLPSFVVLPCV